MRYRGRSIECEAVQWDGTADDALSVIAWIVTHGGEAQYIADDRPMDPTLPTPRVMVRRADGWAYAASGHYVVMGEARFNGGTEGCGHRLVRDFYPCDPLKFALRWEPV